MLMVRSLTKTLYLFSIVAFIFVTIFDPADVVLGLKVPLFILCFITGGLFLIGHNNGRIYIPMPLIIYTLLFISIPLFSIFIYYLRSGADPYEGFAMFKAYLFIFFAILLVVTKIDVTKYLCSVLSIMSVCIISLFIFLIIFPDYFLLINAIGNETEIFSSDQRSYGGDLIYQQAYFVCSPMLVIPIAYYLYRFRESKNTDFLSLILLIVSFFGLLLAGSRNNMFAALFMLPSLYIIFSRKKILPIVLTSSFLIIFILINANEIAALLDPSEVSNSTKLGYLPDYALIFSDLNNLFFGQGLGSYYNFSILSYPYFITELTYFELFRNFGLILGLLMFIMLIYPIFISLRLEKRALLQKYMAIAYSFYLIMCFTNPNLFNSLGILILCILISGLYRDRRVVYYNSRS